MLFSIIVFNIKPTVSASSLVVRMDASQAFDPGPNPG